MENNMEQTLAPKSVELSEIEIDALKEICNIGMGHAATALNQMIGRSVNLDVPEAGLVAYDDIPDLLGGPDAIVAGIYLKIWGDINGNMLLVFSKNATDALCELLTGSGADPDLNLSEMHSSALREIGNILASSYLGALERLLGKTLIPSIPTVAYDMAGAVVDYIIMQLGEEMEKPVVVKATFADHLNGISGHMYLLPDPASLHAILEAARVLHKSRDAKAGEAP